MLCIFHLAFLSFTFHWYLDYKKISAVSTNKIEDTCLTFLKNNAQCYLIVTSIFPKQEAFQPSSTARQQGLIHEFIFPKFVPFFMYVRGPWNICAFCCLFDVLFFNNSVIQHLTPQAVLMQCLFKNYKHCEVITLIHLPCHSKLSIYRKQTPFMLQLKCTFPVKL